MNSTDSPQPHIADPAAYDAQMREIQRKHNVVGRDCHECTICCTVMQVGELEKPSYSPCQHCTTSGCGIYHIRPTTCRGWSCEWWLGRLGLSDDQRPDKLGLMFTHDADSVLAFEVTPGSALTEEALRVLELVKSRYPLKFNAAGSPYNIHLDASDTRTQVLSAPRPQ